MNCIIEHIQDVFRALGPISSRAMFGGHGIFREGIMFALVIDETLFLRTDDITRERFEAIGSVPFRHIREGRPIAMPYHEAPINIYNDPVQARIWGELAWAAAKREKKQQH